MPISAAEQYLIELINRARLDPLAEEARLGIALNRDLAPGTITAAPRQALAPNAILEDIAVDHAGWILANDIFSHTGANGWSVVQRAANAGYQTISWARPGENLALWGTSGSVNLETAIVTHYEGLYGSASHRVNTFAAAYREIGVAQQAGSYKGFNASVLVETFGIRAGDHFVTGAAYRDDNSNAFYNIGEGLGGIRITVGTLTATTAGAGGYAQGVAPGTAVPVTVRDAGGALIARLAMDLSEENGKLDLVQGRSGGWTLALSASAELQEGAGAARLLGIGDLNLTGHGGANVLTGNNGANVLKGAAGNDLLIGNRGNDWLSDGSGMDTLEGGSGEDRFVMAADDHADRILDFRPGVDRIDLTAWVGLTGHGQLTLAAVAGGVRVSHGSQSVIVEGPGVTVAALNAAQFIFGSAPPPPPPPVPDPLPGPGDILGTSGNDPSIGGTSGADRIFGLGGNDSLHGSSGNDSLFAGAGADHLDGGSGGDLMAGGLGNDVYVIDSLLDRIQGELGFSQGGGIDTVLAGVSVTLWQNIEMVRLTGTGAISVTGLSSPETLVGNDAANTLNGMGGNDRLVGQGGNDVLIGGGGADTLAGLAGADVFRFAEVADSRTGAATRDFINDMTRGEDRIDLSLIDADPDLGGDQAFAFLGAAAFTGAGGEVRYAYWGGTHVLAEADLNGDRVADLQIFVNGVTALGAGDFIL
jgi:Ca2+-binding RTX toxin-like protein